MCALTACFAQKRHLRHKQYERVIELLCQAHEGQQVSTVAAAAATDLVATGELANGALYDPIYDCIKYYAPITEAEYEAWVRRWTGAFKTTIEYFRSSEGTMAAAALDKKADMLQRGFRCRWPDPQARSTS